MAKQTVSVEIDVPEGMELELLEKHRGKSYKEDITEMTDFFIPKFKPKRWRAEKEETYFFVDTCGQAIRDKESSIIDKGIYDSRYNIGNYYCTQEEAEAAAERVRKAYKNE